MVLPSREESFGVPLIEALSKNCRVCASKAGALPEVGGHFVNYFELDSECSFRRAIRSALIQTHDWVQLSEHLDQFDRKTVSDKVKEVIQ